MTRDEMTAVLEKKAEKGNHFARKVLYSMQRGRTLTAGQIRVIERMAEEVAEEKKAVEATPAMGVNFAAIVELFDAAKSDTHGKPLVDPKIVLRDHDGEEVQFRVTTRGVMPGSIIVTGRYPSRKFFGRIRQDGGFLPGKDAKHATYVLLSDFSANPLGTVVAYGQLTGQCCFCRLTLTDDRSVEKGYGPICAGNWNLPWGK